MTLTQTGQISPEDRLLILALSRIPGLGPVTFKDLLGKFQSVRQVCKAKSTELRECLHSDIVKVIKSADLIELAKNYESEICELGINYTTVLDSDYPGILKEIHDPPIVLYYRGDLSNKSIAKAISVVGTRDYSKYGEVITRQLVCSLVEAGFIIVSGMAFGIDKIAHEAALEAEGTTIAVLPNGVEKSVPRSNEQLFQKILQKGLVVSERAVETELHSGMFPSRNRIISGLTLGTLVVEAGVRSGALITAYQALEQGREVFAVPGDIMREKSEGTNLLIKRGGAKLIQSVSDILEEFGIFGKDLGRKQKNYIAEEQRIVDAIISGFNDVDKLSQHLCVNVSELLGIISIMEIECKLAKNEKNQYFVLK
ncbi:MAG: DNA-processing protein DprA [Candidatus Dojkabacteria bacterium]|nr:DNA-processing protein DprA [Candidatus Dojkabacteria bacterium]